MGKKMDKRGKRSLKMKEIQKRERERETSKGEYIVEGMTDVVFLAREETLRVERGGRGGEKTRGERKSKVHERRKECI